MDFTPTEAQSAARDLAATVFGDLATPERLSRLGSGSDPELWRALCASGLTAAAEDVGLLGLVLLLEEQGRRTAQTPLAVTTAYGLLPVAAHGTDDQRVRLLPGLRDGTRIATGALTAGACAVRSSDPGRLTGTVPWVPWLRDATDVLVADVEQALWWVRVADARAVEDVETTAPWAAGRLVLEATPAERLGAAPDPPPRSGQATPAVPSPHTAPSAYGDVLATARVAFAGLQAGVCAGSLARAVEHTAVREQFGRPLSTHQAVLMRAADAYMDTEAIRVTAYEAAWRRDEGLPYDTHALTAAWWASEAGKRVVHTGQHLHGGLGADLDHPVHRHFLWGRQLDAYVGCGSEVLAELGALLAREEEAA
ncbi:acyl-CoA dehydrogenase family protein [Streptomyces sp. NPDC048057]|uniref:acyl-CoA dehydrogenase family protein n=1 Tax=Streptomyces sp. NPDC048057 TaxID=3155628 RepID=UPI00340CBDC0